MGKIEIFNNEEICLKIKELYEKGLSSIKISKLLNISKPTVLKSLDFQGISKRKKEDYTAKLNEDYFQVIDTKDKAYFLGWMISDGCVCQNKTILAIQEEDIEILKKFKRYLKYEGNICYSNLKDKNPTYKNMVKMTIFSQKLVSDLINLGCMYRKTHHTYFPNISEEFYSHFIRGYFDGDGCISINNRDYQFNIIGNIKIVEEIQNILIKKCNLKKSKLNKLKNTKDNIVNFNYWGSLQLESIREYLYKDCEDLYLERKKNKFEQVVSKSIRNTVCSKCGKKAIAKNLCTNHYTNFRYNERKKNKLLNI